MKGGKFIPVLVVAAGLLAYQNSFTGPFIYDDRLSILDNPTIRHLWPIWQPLSPPHRTALTVAGRPLINLSLAINYALGGYHVRGYHVFNLAVHILAGLTLLGIVRRTLLQPALRERFGAAANGLALAITVLWLVHPLQTEAVTYVIQRAESIMGLLYLLTLYCFIRGKESRRPWSWYGLCLIACALGMASKEVMVSAPLMVLLYDRAFLTGSFREAWRRRWLLYVGLASTWVLLVLVLVSAGNFATALTKAEIAGIRWWQYLATQPGVILRYLRLSVWPHPLCFDFHGWPIAKTWPSILPPTVVAVALLGASVWAWRTRPAWGFVGAWFFLILAPSSSFIPLNDMIYEHRMYLSLAAVVGILVTGLYALTGRHSFVVFVLLAVGLGFLTWQRNQDYRSGIAFWSDVVAKFPNNPAAHDNLAVALSENGRLPEAVQHWSQALRIKPDYAGAHSNLAIALGRAGRIQEAIEHYEQALRISPEDASVHYNMANAFQQAGEVQEAMAHYEQALRINPDLAEAHYNFAVTLVRLGRVPEAIGHYEQAVRINPDFATAHNHLGIALEQAGRVQEAVGHWEQALRINPDYAEVHSNLGAALGRVGRTHEAIKHLEQALRISPEDAGVHYNLGVALEQVGRVQEAIGQYAQALRIKPDFAEAQMALARLRQRRTS